MGIEGVDMLHRQMESEENGYLQSIKKHAMVVFLEFEGKEAADSGIQEYRNPEGSIRVIKSFTKVVEDSFKSFKSIRFGKESNPRM